MKALLTTVLLLTACGQARYEYVGKPISNWKTVASASVTIGTFDKMLLAETTSVTYTSAQTNNITLDVSGVVVGADTNDSLSLGSLGLGQLVVNNLNQCGAGSDPCLAARVIIYTTELVGYEGIAGFVNKTDGSYGVPILVEGVVVGLTSSSAAEAESVALTGLNRLRDENFTGPYSLSVDMSNAGYGDYEATITVDVQLGN